MDINRLTRTKAFAHDNQKINFVQEAKEQKMLNKVLQTKRINVDINSRNEWWDILPYQQYPSWVWVKVKSQRKLFWQWTKKVDHQSVQMAFNKSIRCFFSHNWLLSTLVKHFRKTNQSTTVPSILRMMITGFIKDRQGGIICCKEAMLWCSCLKLIWSMWSANTFVMEWT